MRKNQMIENNKCVLGLFTSSTAIKKDELEYSKICLADLGFKVKSNDQELIGLNFIEPDAQSKTIRLLALLAEKNVDVLLACRGGSGSIHMLKFLDRYLGRSLQEKRIIGFSDLTAILNYFSNTRSWITFHGPVALTLARASEDEKQSFLQRLQGDWSGELAGELTNDLEFISQGSVQAQLFGGNLCILAGLCGTPWQISFRNRIAFLEEVNEAPYQIERMLSQLQYSGCLDGIRGIVLGSFYYKGELLSNEILRNIFTPYFQNLDIPVVSNFPAGHGGKNHMLPLGAFVKISSDPLSLTVTDKRLNS